MEATAATNTTEAEERPSRRQRKAAYSYKIASVTWSEHDDLDEQAVVTRLQRPIIRDNEGFDQEKLQKGMNEEMDHMKKHDVYEEVSTDTVDQETLHRAIDSRWVHKNKTPTEVRSRIVAKGYKEGLSRHLRKHTTLCHLTCPTYSSIGKILEDPSRRRLYSVPTRAAWHQEGATLWRLKKAMYGLRSSPKALQDYFATSIEEPGFRRLLSEANVYANSANDVYIMVYVDDVRVTGDPSKVNKIFETIQEKMLLKRTGYLDLGESHYFLSRQIHNEGNYFDIKLEDGYIETVLQEVNMTKCNPAPAPGTAVNTSTCAEPLAPDQHKVYQRVRVVGKLQWLSFTRPYQGIGKRTTSTNRSRLEESKTATPIPTWNKQLHTTTPTDNNTEHKQSSPRLDADWAGCPPTSKSTTGFLIYILGTPVSFGLWTQATQ